MLRHPNPMQEVHYKVPWRTSSSFPGYHASQQKGGGLQFRHHVPLADAPDPRRFDLRASLNDPFKQIRVRVYQQRSNIPVVVIADLSASMGFVGQQCKMQTLATFVESISYSAYRTGDTFGFIGMGDEHTQPWLLPQTLNRSAGKELATALSSYQPIAANAAGLLKAAEHLGGRRALVFLLSDFHFPLAFCKQLMTNLAYHDVVPVVLWDQQEYQYLPSFGLAHVTDAETQQSKTLFMRPRLKQQIEANFAQRKTELFDLFGAYGRSPLLLEQGFNADEVTHYFFA